MIDWISEVIEQAKHEIYRTLTTEVTSCHKPGVHLEVFTLPFIWYCYCFFLLIFMVWQIKRWWAVFLSSWKSSFLNTINLQYSVFLKFRIMEAKLTSKNVCNIISGFSLSHCELNLNLIIYFRIFHPRMKQIWYQLQHLTSGPNMQCQLLLKAVTHMMPSLQLPLWPWEVHLLLGWDGLCI